MSGKFLDVSSIVFLMAKQAWMCTGKSILTPSFQALARSQFCRHDMLELMRSNAHHVVKTCFWYVIKPLNVLNDAAELQLLSALFGGIMLTMAVPWSSLPMGWRFVCFSCAGFNGPWSSLRRHTILQIGGCISCSCSLPIVGHCKLCAWMQAHPLSSS